jgi:hypothetical protein
MFWQILRHHQGRTYCVKSVKSLQCQHVKLCYQQFLVSKLK